MSFLLKWALALSLINSAVAADINQCTLIKTLKERVAADRMQLDKVIALYEAGIVASEIHERLPELTSDTEIINLSDRLESDQDINRAILLLADALGREASDRNADSVDMLPFAGVSAGSLILSSYIVKKMNQEMKGQGLRALFTAHFKSSPSGKMKYVKYGLNMSFLGGVIGSLYLAHRTYKNTMSALELKELMGELEKVSIDAERIVTLRNRVEEDMVRIEQMEWSSPLTCE